MSHTNKLTALLAASVFSTGVMMAQGGQAAVLDFSSLTGGTNPGTTFVIPDAVVTAEGGALFKYPESGHICSMPYPEFSCAADLEIDFTSDVTDVSFSTAGFNVGDYVDLMVYGIGDLLVGSVAITGNGFYDLTGFGVISSLFFDDSSTGYGFEYDQISYTLAPAVPLPAGLPLLLTGIAAFAGLSRKRRAA